MAPSRKNKKGKNKKGRSDGDANAAESKAATSNLTNGIDHERELNIMRMKFYLMELMHRKLHPLQKAMDITREGIWATIDRHHSAQQAHEGTNGTKLQHFLIEEDLKRTKHAYKNILYFQEMHSIMQDKVMETIHQFRDDGSDNIGLIPMVAEVLGSHSMYAGVLGGLSGLIQ